MAKKSAKLMRAGETDEVEFEVEVAKLVVTKKQCTKRTPSHSLSHSHALSHTLAAEKFVLA